MHPLHVMYHGRSSAAFQAVVAFVALAALLVLPFTQAAPDTAAVWVADQKQLKRVDPAVNQYVQAIALSNAAEAIAFDAKSNVLWALANKHLLKFGAGGVPMADYDLAPQAQSTEALKRLVLDPYDASLWAAGEKTVLHVNAQGQILLKWTSSQNIQAIGLDPDQSLWVLSQNALYQLSPAGTVLNNLALPATLIPDPSFLAIDGLGGYMWVAGTKHLIRFDANDLTKPPFSAAVPATVNGTNNKLEALLTHPIFGIVWAVSTDNLLIYDRDATLVRQTSLTPHALGIPQAIAYEPGSASLWLGGKTALGRFAPSGDFVTKLPANVAISAIATGPFSVNPTLTLLEPINNSITNNPRLPFRLGLGAECNGQACDLVDAYTQAFTLDATLNGLAIGPMFSLANREALYLPPTRLPEGINLFSAQAKDIFGHLSNRINSQVTIDTIPPTFLSLNPADGSILTIPGVIIAGTVDDPTASVMLQDQVGAVLNIGGENFNFSITLQHGLNTFTLVARDPVGNETRATLRLVYQQPINLTITSPKNGDALSVDKVSVLGALSGPPGTTVTVNGIPATLDATGNFIASNVPLVAGSNRITALATAPDGRVASQELTLFVSTPEQGNWGTPRVIETRIGQADYPAVAMNFCGEAIAVWTQWDDSKLDQNIYANNYAVGGTWGTQYILDASKGYVGPPEVAMDANGNAIAAWKHVGPYEYRVKANRFEKARGWTGTIVFFEGNGADPKIAMNAQGDATTVWAAPFYGNADVAAKRYTIDGGWKTREFLEYDNYWIRLPTVAMDSKGNATSVWMKWIYFADGYDVFSNTYTADSGWGSEAQVNTSFGHTVHPDVAMGSQGHTVAAWMQQEKEYPYFYSLMVSYREPGGDWQPPVLIDSSPHTPFSGYPALPKVKVDGKGNAIVVWLGSARYGSNLGGLTGFQEELNFGLSVLASHYVAGKGWSTSVRLDFGIDETLDNFSVFRRTPQIAMDSQGNAVAVWTTRGRVWASRYAIGSGWSPPSDLGNGNVFPRVAMDNCGNSVVVWRSGLDILSNTYVAHVPGSVPIVVPPPNITTEATDVLTPVALGIATATDEKEGPLVATPDKTSPFSVGTHLVTWKATNSVGRSSTAVQTVIVRDTTPPSLIVPSPITVTVTDPNQLPIVVNLGAAMATDIFNVTISNNAPARFQPGITHVTWTATDANGNVTVGTQLVTVTFTGTVYLDITRPVSGSEIYDENTVSLAGVFQGPTNTGVSANGTIGFVDGDKVYINNVPLNPGNNTITVTATTPDGVAFTRTISITNINPPPLHVSTRPESGIAPSKTQFFVSMRNEEIIQRLFVDYQGDGSVDCPSLFEDICNPIQYTYSNPGVYPARISVRTTLGHVYGVTHTIGVKKLSDVDAMLRGVYATLIQRLKAGNIESALNLVSGGMREKYRAVFTALQPNLATVVDQLGTIQGGGIGEGFAEYVLTRQENGVTKGYLIQFLRGEDGVWRIDGM